MEHIENTCANPNQEYLLSYMQNMEILSSTEILKDDEIWFADTGATNCASFCKRGAEKVRKSTMQAQGITGPAIGASYEMDVPVTACNRYGQELDSFVLADMACNKTVISICSLLVDV